VLAIVTVAVLALGAGTAAAHGGRWFGGSTEDLVAGAAQRLGSTTAALKKAITDAATTRIDEAVADGDVDAEAAEDVKDEIADDNLRLAMLLSRTRTVAANLGKSTTELNTAFREARRALLVARVDEALADGDLDAEDASRLRERIAKLRLPGYRSLGFGLGLGWGLGFGLGRGHGLGLGTRL
jgi:hypothetical protein